MFQYGYGCWTICTGKALSAGYSGSNLPPHSHSVAERGDPKPEGLLLDDSFRLKIPDLYGTGLRCFEDKGVRVHDIHGTHS